MKYSSICNSKLNNEFEFYEVYIKPKYASARMAVGIKRVSGIMNKKKGAFIN